tara:strand:- start:14504 stop:15019 length:516 start_codon:yes stop_codon:yes gene_type:complete
MIINTSKTLSYILRHRPDKFNIKVDKYGWANVDNVLNELNIDLEHLNEVVKENDKKRFSFNEDKTMIRANQGHSFKVDLGLKKIVPPFILYHGTKKDHVDSIMKKGLSSMTRNHVHLSEDIDTAHIVASRRKGEDAILEIKAREMYSDGVDIFLSENGVYLTKFVDSKYIK